MAVIAGQPSTYIDAPALQTVRHGSQLVFFSNAGTLVAEQIDYKKDVREIDLGDDAQRIGIAAYIPQKGRGTMIVQLKSATTRIERGETVFFYNTDPAVQIAALVIGVGMIYQQNSATKVEVTVVERMNN